MGEARIVRLALDEPELSPRELATRFIDTKGYFISEASVYRLLKAHDLITSPAFVVVKAADAFKDKTVRPNQLWQTVFTYLKAIGWGWFHLSTILDDFSRHIVTWKLCTRRCRPKTSPTPWNWRSRHQAAIGPSSSISRGCRRTTDPAIASGNLAEWLDEQSIEHARGAP